jgi:hypothetical protein
MAVAYVAIDVQGVRDLAKVLQDTATRAEAVRRETVGGLKLADLSSQAPLQLALVQDGFSRLANGVADKANAAEDGIIIDDQPTWPDSPWTPPASSYEPWSTQPASEDRWTVPEVYETSDTPTDSGWTSPTDFVTDW